jgi:hypothetical protein
LRLICELLQIGSMEPSDASGTMDNVRAPAEIAGRARPAAVAPNKTSRRRMA